MNNYFYCYSNRMYHFIKVFDVEYISVGVNKNTYYVFPKSEKLDKIIALYNEVKHSIQ